MGKPRLCRRGRPDWRTKLNPLFLESAELLKAAFLRQRMGDPNAAADFFARVEELQKKYPTRENAGPVPADIIYSGVTDISDGFKEWLHWNRFRTPLHDDIRRAHDDHDISASIRRNQTAQAYDDRRSNPNWQPKFKRDLDHGAMFECGLGLGLESLTEEELADCFDALCPCGCRHNPDALRKQRNRYAADFHRAIAWKDRQRK